MLEFKIIQKLKPNNTLLNALSPYDYKINLGHIKVIQNTNLQMIKPTTYIITSPIQITILEYKINEISNKPFYIKENNKKYSLNELITYLSKNN